MTLKKITAETIKVTIDTPEMNLAEKEIKEATLRWIRDILEDTGMSLWQWTKLAGINVNAISRFITEEDRGVNYLVVGRLAVAVHKDFPKIKLSKEAQTTLPLGRKALVSIDVKKK